MTKSQKKLFDTAVLEVEEGDSEKAITLLLKLKKGKLPLTDRIRVESTLSIAYSNMSSWPQAICTAKHALRMSERTLNEDLIREKCLELCDTILLTGKDFNSFLKKYEDLFWHGHIMANFTVKRCLVKLIYHEYLETPKLSKKSEKLRDQLRLLTARLLSHTAEEIGASIREYFDMKKIYSQVIP